MNNREHDEITYYETWENNKFIKIFVLKTDSAETICKYCKIYKVVDCVLYTKYDDLPEIIKKYNITTVFSYVN